MDTLVKADIFFFVATIAVVVVSIGFLLSLYYVVGAVKRLEAYAERIEERMKDAGSEVKEMGEDIRESFLYNLIFKKKKKRKAGVRDNRD